MKRNNSESGNIHVVIIAVLFVALMATLGVVFYQNFIAKKPESTQRNEKPVVESPVEATARVAFGSDIYEFDHKSNWKAEATKLKESVMGGSTLKITSSDGKTQVAITITETKPDHTCDGNDGLKISSYHVGSTTSNRLTGAPLYLVESLYDVAGGGYQYKIGLTPDSGDTHAVVGETHCNIEYVGTASTVLMKEEKLVNPTIVATIEFPKLPVMPGAAAQDMQTIKELMATDDYKAAVRILESARKE